MTRRARVPLAATAQRCRPPLKRSFRFNDSCLHPLLKPVRPALRLPLSLELAPVSHCLLVCPSAPLPILSLFAPN